MSASMHACHNNTCTMSSAQQNGIIIPSPSPPPPLPSVVQVPTVATGSHKTLASIANLANLLPTGTVLIFQGLVPSFSNDGECYASNKYLTGALLVICSLACFLSSFTDSFVHCNKLYYGIATPKGLYIFNDEEDDSIDVERNEEQRKVMERYRLKWVDFVHAFSSLMVFLVVAVSSSEVQGCYFKNPGQNTSQLIKNLPLGGGVLASIVFFLFPTKRRGIGFADTAPQSKQKDKSR